MSRWRVPVVLLSAFAAYAIAILARTQGAVLSLLSDDAFYYFVIARNTLAGEGFTFDGVAPTNGFHPLWMLVMLPVFALTGGETAPLVAVMLLCGLVATATLYLIYRVVERYMEPGYGIVGVCAALLPNLLTAMLNGLETGLQLLLAVGLVGACHRFALLDPGASTRRVAVLGALVGVVTLGRLDSVFLVAAALVMGVVGWRRLPAAQTLARAVALGTGFALVVGPYLLWNVVSFGHLAPSSSATKSAFPRFVQQFSLSGDTLWGAVMLAVLWALIGCTHALDRRRGAGRPFWASPVTMIAIASSLHFVHVFLYMAWGVYWWHFTLYGLGIVLALPSALAALVGSQRRAGRLAATAAAVALAALAARAKFLELPPKAAQHAGWLDAARWAREQTNEGDVFALADAGLFAYFAHRPVVNLDGKANSYEYLRHVEAGTVPQYLASVGTRYVASTRVRYNRFGTCWLAIPGPHEPPPSLEMDETWEIYRGAEIATGLTRGAGRARTSHFTIWKLPDGYGR